MTAIVNLRLSGSVDHLQVAWQVGETLLASMRFEADAESVRFTILVSLQEMLTNVLRHAYGGDDTQPIEVEFCCSDEAFCVELRDGGPEFDPRGYDLGRLPDGDQVPQQVGGYGIMIALTCMDRIEYQRRDGKNHLRMTKYAGGRTLAEAD